MSDAPDTFRSVILGTVHSLNDWLVLFRNQAGSTVKRKVSSDIFGLKDWPPRTGDTIEVRADGIVFVTRPRDAVAEVEPSDTPRLDMEVVFRRLMAVFVEALAEQGVRLPQVDAECDRLEAERDEYALVALTGLAGIVGTPARGYVADGGPGQLRSDLHRMRTKFAMLRDENQLLKRENRRLKETAPRDWFADVCEFHRTCGSVMNPTPTIPGNETASFRLALMMEEFTETVVAIKAGNLPEIADGLADLAYVLIGTAVSYGIDLRLVWEAVQRANMAKVGGGRRADGKHLKPPDWTPPDIAGVLALQPPIPEAGDVKESAT